ncbi:hypothetical protein TRICI_004345 [Trichomonascus ciferrii]|uniref:2,3-diketo-5-methylthio-1-phosphopentane phosphatase n=1 Tax=Trichomonascus ciferrii TaxID=44093 RepID=A0A642V2L3_9ASCO|nr:hypothetical protein TRICI_004345 [Trichomonascus ciferrii]
MSLQVPKPSNGNSKKHNNRPIAVFSDFDGTIFHQDTGHVLFDKYGCGQEKREELDGSIGDTRSFREASELMWGSLTVSLDEALELLKKDLVLDDHFKPFLDFCDEQNIPFSVISAGLQPLLRGALDQFLGKERSSKINIVSNDAEIDGSNWKPLWRHDCELGHDKARSINEMKETVFDGAQPLTVFVGDGVSDLAAANHADILFARRGLKLEKYCIKNKIPYIPYDTFEDVQVELERMINAQKEDEQDNRNATANIPKNPVSGRPIALRTVSENSVPNSVLI